ncbi:MAG: DMT family transporter [Paracoccaceae bacterium]|nr:DMT family transporter [Paracoccaceae bacterium]MDG2259015.1 DMT family transporter [Paracoccaceae bacterium]
MLNSNLGFASIMLLAGIGIPILAALNSSLGTRIGSPITAAAILFTIAVGGAWVIAAIAGFPGLSAVASAPKHLLLAGLLVLFYVLSITIIAPKFGVGNAVFFVLLGQIVSATLIDHFGLFGAAMTQISLTRMLGLGLMVAGIGLTRLT